MAVYKKVPGCKTVNISTLEFDTKPTKGSFNPVTSDGMATQSSNIAEAFSASSTYAIGEVVIGPDGKLYQCTTAVETAGEWDPEDWDETSLGDILFTSRGSSNIEVRKSRDGGEHPGGLGVRWRGRAPRRHEGYNSLQDRKVKHKIC